MMKELGIGTRFDNVLVCISNESHLHVAGNRTFNVALLYFIVQELVKRGRISIYIKAED